MRPQDPEHWLYRFTPQEWIRKAMGELSQARAAYATRDARGGLAGCRRAAGVALNAWLATLDEPMPSYGRTYMEHLASLQDDDTAPAVVREAARTLRTTPLAGGDLILLRTAGSDERVLDATETILAHSYAEVLRSESAPPSA